MGNLYTPHGDLIVGTREQVLTTSAFGKGAVVRQPNGAFYIKDYSGDSEAHWDTQEQVIENGQPLWVDENEQEWQEKDLIFYEDGHEPAVELDDAAQSLEGEMLAALRSAATQFRFYETVHRSKGTLDGSIKADVNAQLAAKMEAVLQKREAAQ